VRRRRRSQKKQ